MTDTLFMILNSLTTALLFIISMILFISVTGLTRNFTRLLAAHRDMSSMLQKKKERANKHIALSEKQKLAQEVIDKGSTIVENVHKTISNITFGILKSTPATGQTSRIVRKIHDRTAGGVYNSIRLINKGIGNIADELLGTDKDRSPEDTSRPDNTDETEQKK